MILHIGGLRKCGSHHSHTFCAVIELGLAWTHTLPSPIWLLRRRQSVAWIDGHYARLINLPAARTPFFVLSRAICYFAGFLVLSQFWPPELPIVQIRTDCDPETFGGRGDRGGFGTGGAGGCGRPGGLGGFGSGFLGGRIGSGTRGGFLLLITLALATLQPSWRTSPVETYHPCQAGYVSRSSLASVSLYRLCNGPIRTCRSWVPCRPFRKVPWFTSHGIIWLE